MTLPRGKDKEEMIKAGSRAALAKEAKEKQEAEAKAKAEKAEQQKKFNEYVKGCVERIESDILYAIEKGKRTTSFNIPRNYGYDRYLEAWQHAVTSLRKKYGKDYVFDIQPKTLYCDNAGEAANVDYVTFKTWTEDVHELTVNW